MRPYEMQNMLLCVVVVYNEEESVNCLDYDI